jgi:hypothetical protein
MNALFVSAASQAPRVSLETHGVSGEDRRLKHRPYPTDGGLDGETRGGRGTRFDLAFALVSRSGKLVVPALKGIPHAEAA